MTPLRNLALISLICITWPVYAAMPKSDMRGSQDHVNIPRVDGTKIVGYAHSDYDEGVFVTGMQERELITDTVEGKRTRIMYLGSKELSPFGILRNYQKAFDDLGQVEEVFSCRVNTCFSNLGNIFIWRKNNRTDNTLGMGSDSLYAFGNYQDQSYWYGKIQSTQGLYHVSVYTTVLTDLGAVEIVKGHPVIHLEVVEVADFKPTLKVVKAKEMSANISEKGHIALYGIYFDTDSDVLKPESVPTLDEIAKTLDADSELKIYVVGHTDNQGQVEYNLDLSRRRAASVVRVLTDNHGIAKDRLVPIGVGLAAPVATNDSEEGRALNRRVELVKR